MNKSDYSTSRPNTAATGMSSLQNSSTDSFTYSVISSKFESTGEVILLPKVNARRSIKFKTDGGPRIIAVRETAQWLISKNNNVADDLSKEVQRLDDSYLKWYRKHFNDKRDVLDRVSNLLNSAKKEKNDRCVSFSSFYKNNSTPASRRSRVHSMQNSPRKGLHTPCFATELPDVEDVEKVGQAVPEADAPIIPQLYGEPTNSSRSPTKPMTSPVKSLGGIKDENIECEKKEKKVVIITPTTGVGEIEGASPTKTVKSGNVTPPKTPKSVKSVKSVKSAKSGKSGGSSMSRREETGLVK